MSEVQLREAVALMKQGDKQNAARLVQDVLREDRSNADASWLFADPLDDKAGVIYCLETVLELEPEHLAAAKSSGNYPPIRHVCITYPKLDSRVSRSQVWNVML